MTREVFTGGPMEEELLAYVSLFRACASALRMLAASHALDGQSHRLDEAADFADEAAGALQIDPSARELELGRVESSAVGSSMLPSSTNLFGIHVLDLNESDPTKRRNRMP